jgi:hypothetical protein
MKVLVANPFHETPEMSRKVCSGNLRSKFCVFEPGLETVVPGRLVIKISVFGFAQRILSDQSFLAANFKIERPLKNSCLTCSQPHKI